MKNITCLKLSESISAWVTWHVKSQSIPQIRLPCRCVLHARLSGNIKCGDGICTRGNNWTIVDHTGSDSVMWCRTQQFCKILHIKIQTIPQQWHHADKAHWVLEGHTVWQRVSHHFWPIMAFWDKKHWKYWFACGTSLAKIILIW